MSNKTKWMLMGSGIGFVVAISAIGLTLLIVRPNLQGHDVGGLPAGQIAPDFTATDVNGNTVRLNDFRGQPVLLKFWSPECPPCVSEVPDFQEAYESLGDETVFLTVVARKPATTVKSSLMSVNR